MNSLNLTIILGEGGIDHVKGGLQQFECTSCISLLPWIQVDEQNRNLSQFRQPADFMTMVNLHQKEKKFWSIRFYRIQTSLTFCTTVFKTKVRSSTWASGVIFIRKSLRPGRTMERDWTMIILISSPPLTIWILALTATKLQKLPWHGATVLILLSFHTYAGSLFLFPWIWPYHSRLWLSLCWHNTWAACRGNILKYTVKCGSPFFVHYQGRKHILSGFFLWWFRK